MCSCHQALHNNVSLDIFPVSILLQHVLSNASEILFHATRNRSYFEEFILVIPPTWTNVSGCDGDVNEVPRSIDIYVTDVPSLTTQHSRGCGEVGDVIYMPINWLTGEVEGEYE